MNELMRRRRALMAAQGGSSNVLFEWDYTDGMAGINSVASIAPTMESDGLLLKSGSSDYSTCAIAPSIPSLSTSYRATITYKNISIPSNYGDVGFFHYRTEEKSASLHRINENGTPKSMFLTVDRTKIYTGVFLPDITGEMVIEWDKNTSTLTFAQGQNSYSATLSGESTWAQQTRLVSAQKGEGSGNISVKITHIKIERL